MRARTRIQKCAEFFLLMKSCAGKHYFIIFYFLLCPFCRSMQKVIPSPSISFDTLDVMQQSRLSCGPSVTTGRERERELLSFLTLIWCDSTLIWIWIWQRKWTDCRFQWREIEPIINSQWHSTQVLFFNLWFIYYYFFLNIFKNQRQCVSCYAYIDIACYVSVLFFFFSPFLAQFSVESVLGWSHLSTMISEPFSVI